MELQWRIDHCAQSHFPTSVSMPSGQAHWCTPMVLPSFQFLGVPAFLLQVQELFPFKYQDLSRATSGRPVRLYTVLPTLAKYWSLWNLKRFALFYSVLDARSKRSSSKNTVFQLLCFAASEENCEAKELEPNGGSIGKWRANGWLQSLGSRGFRDDVLSRKQWEGRVTSPSTQH